MNKPFKPQEFIAQCSDLLPDQGVSGRIGWRGCWAELLSEGCTPRNRGIVNRRIALRQIKLMDLPLDIGGS